MVTRFTVEDVFNISGATWVLTGRVDSGMLRPGMRFEIDGESVKVRSLQINHENVNGASEGYPADISVRSRNPGKMEFLKGTQIKLQEGVLVRPRSILEAIMNIFR